MDHAKMAGSSLCVYRWFGSNALNGSASAKVSDAMM
jgi:hypothetical protein